MKKFAGRRIFFTLLLHTFFLQSHYVEAQSPEVLSDYGPWVGSWRGTSGSQGPEYELAIWMNNKGAPATAIIFEDCISIVYFSKSQDYWFGNRPVRYYNADGEERQTHKVFELSSVIGRRRDQYDLDNTACKAGPLKRFRFMVIGDQESQVMLINNDTQFQYADSLKKSDVSERMAKAILKVQPFARMTISEDSKAALCDSSIRYLDQINHQTPVTKPCGLFAQETTSLASHSLGVWKENYHDLGELYYYVYHKEYDKAKEIDQYLTGFIDFLEVYSANCRNEMPGPKTEIVRTWSREVETEYGGRYTQSQNQSSYVVQDTYLENYRQSYDYYENNVRRYLSVARHAWIPKVFLDNHGGCNSGEVKEMLDRYNEGIAEFLGR